MSTSGVSKKQILTEEDVLAQVLANNGVFVCSKDKRDFVKVEEIFKAYEFEVKEAEAKEVPPDGVVFLDRSNWDVVNSEAKFPIAAILELFRTKMPLSWNGLGIQSTSFNGRDIYVYSESKEPGPLQRIISFVEENNGCPLLSMSGDTRSIILLNGVFRGKLEVIKLLGRLASKDAGIWREDSFKNWTGGDLPSYDKRLTGFQIFCGRAQDDVKRLLEIVGATKVATVSDDVLVIDDDKFDDEERLQIIECSPVVLPSNWLAEAVVRMPRLTGLKKRVSPPIPENVASLLHYNVSIAIDRQILLNTIVMLVEGLHGKLCPSARIKPDILIQEMFIGREPKANERTIVFLLNKFVGREVWPKRFERPIKLDKGLEACLDGKAFFVFKNEWLFAIMLGYQLALGGDWFNNEKELGQYPDRKVYFILDENTEMAEEIKRIALEGKHLVPEMKIFHSFDGKSVPVLPDDSHVSFSSSDEDSSDSSSYEESRDVLNMSSKPGTERLVSLTPLQLLQQERERVRRKSEPPATHSLSEQEQIDRMITPGLLGKLYSQSESEGSSNQYEKPLSDKRKARSLNGDFPASRGSSSFPLVSSSASNPAIQSVHQFSDEAFNLSTNAGNVLPSSAKSISWHVAGQDTHSKKDAPAKREVASLTTGLATSITGTTSKTTGLATSITGTTSKTTGLATSFTGTTSKITGLATSFTGNTRETTGLATSFTGTTSRTTGLASSFTGTTSVTTGLATSFTGSAGIKLTAGLTGATSFKGTVDSKGSGCRTDSPKGTADLKKTSGLSLTTRRINAKERAVANTPVTPKDGSKSNPIVIDSESSNDEGIFKSPKKKSKERLSYSPQGSLSRQTNLSKGRVSSNRVNAGKSSLSLKKSAPQRGSKPGNWAPGECEPLLSQASFHQLKEMIDGRAQGKRKLEDDEEGGSSKTPRFALPSVQGLDPVRPSSSTNLKLQKAKLMDGREKRIAFQNTVASYDSITSETPPSNESIEVTSLDSLPTAKADGNRPITRSAVANLSLSEEFLRLENRFQVEEKLKFSLGSVLSDNNVVQTKDLTLVQGPNGYFDPRYGRFTHSSAKGTMIKGYFPLTGLNLSGTRNQNAFNFLKRLPLASSSYFERIGIPTAIIQRFKQLNDYDVVTANENGKPILLATFGSSGGFRLKPNIVFYDNIADVIMGLKNKALVAYHPHIIITCSEKACVCQQDRLKVKGLRVWYQHEQELAKKTGPWLVAQYVSKDKISIINPQGYLSPQFIERGEDGELEKVLIAKISSFADTYTDEVKTGFSLPVFCKSCKPSKPGVTNNEAMLVFKELRCKKCGENAELLFLGDK